MKSTKKILMLFSAIIILFPISVCAEIIHSGTGVSGSGGASWSTGQWNDGVYGVRVTFVDKNGKRLQLKGADGKTYTSYSIDIYGSIKSSGVTRITNNTKHTNCNGYLCHKAELPSKVEVKNGNYNRGTHWYMKSDFSSGFFTFGDFYRNGQVPSVSFQRLTSNSNYAKELFKACFKVNYDELRKNSGNHCQDNHETLEDGYIIYEPITSIGSEGKNVWAATGSEFAQYQYRDGKTNLGYTILPIMANYARIDKNSCGNYRSRFGSCNLGLTKFKETTKKLVKGAECVGWSCFEKDGRNNTLGYYLGILFTSLPPKNEKWTCNTSDYSVDAACVNCDNNTSGTAYHIQDTTDWEAIMNSDDPDYMCESNGASSATNAKKAENYFVTSSSCGSIYCREEIKVTLPTASNVPTVQRGRYFTVHSPFRNADDTVKAPYSDVKYGDQVKILNETKYDRNWGPIKIEKIKECKMDVEASVGTARGKACMLDAGLEFDKTPTVKLTYEGKLKAGATEAEKAEFSQYEDELTDVILDVEPVDEFGSLYAQDENITSNSYTITNKLDNGKIEYISMLSFSYTANQTISYKLPDNKFRYILKDGGTYTSTKPETGRYIDLGIATIPVSQNNVVFSGGADATLSLSFDLGDDMHLSDSFSRNNNYLPNCGTSTDVDDLSNIYKYAVTKGNVTSSGVSGLTEADKITELAESSCAVMYECKRTSGGISCSKLGVDTCIKDKTINKIGNQNNCFISSQGGDNTYTCPIYVDPGIPIVDFVDKEDCPGCIDPTDDWYRSDNETKCVAYIGNGGVCIPQTGYTKLIYRPIDLTNPFPAKTGNNRKTGTNWCGYNETTKNFNCLWNSSNPVVYEYILNNRGVTGEEVYKLQPMYSVTLDSGDIENLRAYNDSHSYDDFTLRCDEKGEECKLGQGISSYVTVNCRIDGTDPKCEKAGGGS